MFEPKIILVPTDFSEYSDRAVDLAADLAARYGARLMVLHVIEENIKQCAIDYLVDYCLEDDFVTTFERELLKAANERLGTRVGSLRDERKAAVEFEVRKGSPGDVIVEEQVRLGADLIVIASHGRAGAARHTSGSVTEKVARSARVPVLISRP